MVFYIPVSLLNANMVVYFLCAVETVECKQEIKKEARYFRSCLPLYRSFLFPRSWDATYVFLQKLHLKAPLLASR